MKKKILIVIVAVAMMIPLLAVGVCADYSPETGWSEPSGTFDPFISSFSTNNNGVSTTTEVPLGTPGQIVGIINNAGEFSFSYNYRYRIRIYREYWINSTYEDGLLYYDNDAGIYVRFESPVLMTEGSFGNVLVISDGAITFGYMTLDGNAEFFPVGIIADTITYFDVYVEEYPKSVFEVAGYAADVSPFWEQFPFEVYQVAGDPPHPFLALIELMFDNFSRIIGGLAAGVTGAFTALIWENPEATEKSLSTLAKFIFTIAGLSIGMTVFYLVLRLIRFGRQR